MTTPYRCRQCLYYYPEYIFSYQEGFNWCNRFKKEVNPDATGCNDFVLPTVVYENREPLKVDEK